MLLVQPVKRLHRHLGNRLLKMALHLDNQLIRMVQPLDSLQVRTLVRLVGPLKALELHRKLGHLVALASRPLWAKTQVPLVVLLDSLHN